VAEHYDIIIVGGGPVGAALALGLTGSAHRVALLEARPRDVGADDARMIALAHGSRLILERLDAWRSLADLAEITPIRQIAVSEQGHFGRAGLSATDAGVAALGYVASYAAIHRALGSALAQGTAEVMAGAAALEIHDAGKHVAVTVDCAGAMRQLDARLVVIADGGDGVQLARVTERDYGQSALVCDVASDEPHQNRAFERFTRDGPLALLPTPRGWSLVWTARHDRARELAALDERTFCAELRATFGASLGAFRVLGKRQLFRLVLKFTRQPRMPRAVLIGNAAQSLHPVAGQGFNLGLRDAWELALAVRDAHDPGEHAVLNTYFSQRRFDRTATILFTDTLIRLFSNDIPILGRLRGVGLAALSGMAPAKNFLVRRMLFGAHG
jgi:2-octaprenyl-6-methoxyphenol hydroxylase